MKKIGDYLEEALNTVSSIPTVIPRHRSAFKKGFSFSRLPFETQLPIWDHIWNKSGNFRAQMHAYFFLERYVNKAELH